MAMVEQETLHGVEALLMSAHEPLSIDQLKKLLADAGEPDRDAIRTALQALEADYLGRAVNLVEVAGGWRFQVGAEYSNLVGKLWEERPAKLSRAVLETLAIIAYRQPVARSDIEDVRGVSVSTNIIKTLLEREWIRVVGYREVPGRPGLYGTTQGFLNDFSLKQLEDLPSLPELRDIEDLDAAARQLQDKADTESPDDKDDVEDSAEVTQ